MKVQKEKKTFVQNKQDNKLKSRVLKFYSYTFGSMQVKEYTNFETSYELILFFSFFKT